MKRRLLLVILLMVLAETAWALFCAVTGVNLFLFYGVLVAASVVFWVPGLAEKRAKASAAASAETSQTKT